MNPIIIPWAIVLGLIGALSFAYSFKKGRDRFDRGTAMTQLADILYRVVYKRPIKPNELIVAANLAEKLGMPKTVAGLKAAQGLPNDERWPGTELSVAAFVAEYSRGELATESLKKNQFEPLG